MTGGEGERPGSSKGAAINLFLRGDHRNSVDVGRKGTTHRAVREEHRGTSERVGEETRGIESRWGLTGSCLRGFRAKGAVGPFDESAAQRVLCARSLTHARTHAPTPRVTRRQQTQHTDEYTQASHEHDLRCVCEYDGQAEWRAVAIVTGIICH